MINDIQLGLAVLDQPDASLLRNIQLHIGAAHSLRWTQAHLNHGVVCRVEGGSLLF
jgi:hypothetical protein